MKKTKSLLFCLLATGHVLMASGDNLLVNGNFENTDYVAFTYENGNYTNCPNYVSGWDATTPEEGKERVKDDFTNIGLSKYNVRASIVTDSLAENGGQQCIRIQRYEWSKAADNPHDGGLQQTIAALPGNKYTLSFLYRLSAHSENGTIVPAWYSVTEIAEDGTESVAVKQKKLYNNLDHKWYEKSADFTTSATAKQVRVNIGVTGGYIYSWGGNMRMWADFDNVTLVSKEASSIETLLHSAMRLTATADGQTIRIDGLDETADVFVYDIAGNRIAYSRAGNSALSLNIGRKGLFIVSNGNDRNPLKIIIR